MSTAAFAPGQCWISDTESELGIGIVKEEDGRRVTLIFPAAGEERTYARANAPLSRVRYERGDRVRTADGQDLEVREVLERGACIVYRTADAAGAPVEIAEAELDSFARFSRPRDRLLTGQIDSASDLALRVATLEHRHRHERAGSYGLLGPRVQLLAHQLFIAHEVASRDAPRVLLADEVGLGKTIEAGLILHQQLVSGRVDRVLVLTPDGLVLQWLVEMLRRFNLRFTVLDEERCAALEESQEVNPFETTQLAISALRLLSADDRRAAQAAAAGWDLLVVDEAHHLSWSETETSPEYACVERLAGEVPGLLLLTATPEQLGADAHFARLRLLDPHRYPDLDRFRREQAEYEPIRKLVDALLELAPEDARAGALAPGQPLGDALGALLGPDVVGAVAGAAGDEAFARERAAAVQSLLDRHGTGRVLFRNTRDTVGGFPDRRLSVHALEPPAPLREPGLDLDRALRPELALGEDWTSHDPRVAWLCALLRERRGEKLLVICARAATAEALEAHLRLREGVRSASFDEGMSLVARDRAAAYFAEPEAEGGAQVLVCSEIGSEGRNFQFASRLVLFDLPLNPDLLEQRIGRLDRIGQQRTVQIHVPCFEPGPQAALLRWYRDGIDAFERSCPAGRTLFEEFGERLRTVLSEAQRGSAGAQDALDALVTATSERTAALLAALREGRDRLLELNSCPPDRAEAVVEEVVAEARPGELSRYLDGVFDHFGVDWERHGTHSVVVRPGNHMTVPHFPGLPEDGLTATFSRAEALEREDMAFLTWEHPLTVGAMDLILGGESGNTALVSGSLPGMPAGGLLIECYHALHFAAPRGYQLGRYLDQALQRVLVGTAPTEPARALPREEFEARLERVPAEVARQVVRHARGEIGDLLSRAESAAEGEREGRVAEARAAAVRLHEAEIERLRALAEVNPNIREEEIEAACRRRDQIDAALAEARVQLEAVRVVVTT